MRCPRKGVNFTSGSISVESVVAKFEALQGHGEFVAIARRHCGLGRIAAVAFWSPPVNDERWCIELVHQSLGISDRNWVSLELRTLMQSTVKHLQ
jgi:hypothetical protein